MNWLVGMIAGAYLVGAIGFGFEHRITHGEEGFLDSVEYGLLWPGVMLDIVRSPEL